MRTISLLIDSLRPPKDHTVMLVDVGARWGANPPWDQLDNKYIKYMGFEPDTEECDRLMKSFAGTNIEYLPQALSDSFEDKTLNVTREPGCSSIYEPNEDIVSRFFLSDRWDVLKRIPIKTVPLSSILIKKNVSPDVLKIDVQGAALNVLKGTKEHLQHVLVIEAEVEFLRMYKEQPLFSDVDQYLRGFGFELIDLNKFYAKRKKLDPNYSSRGQVLFADVLYVLTVESFYSIDLSPEVRLNKLWSIVITLCLYGHFDLAMDFVDDPRSLLSSEEKHRIRNKIQIYTAIPPWRIFFFNNNFSQKVGTLFSFISNSILIKTRLFGWGSDLNNIDSRYKHYINNPVLRLFRK